MTSQTQNQNSAPTSVEEKVRPHPADECVDKVRPHPADECVDKEPKKQRPIRGLSQHQLAGKPGITLQQVEKYEKVISIVDECVDKVGPYPADECVNQVDECVSQVGSYPADECVNQVVNECVDQVRPSPVDEYVGKELKKQRLMRGLGEHQLAGKLGVTFQQVEKYEKGISRIDECGKVRPHPVDECVGKEIKKQRLIRGLSQHQLAGKLGITFQQVQKYEKGTNRIVISRLYELTQVLGIEVQDLMSKLQDDLRMLSEGAFESALKEGNETTLEEDNGEHQVDSKEILMLVRAFVCIKNEKVRNTIYTLAKSLSADQQDTDFENSDKDSDLKSSSSVSKKKK